MLRTHQRHPHGPAIGGKYRIAPADGFGRTGHPWLAAQNNRPKLPTDPPSHTAADSDQKAELFQNTCQLGSRPGG